MNKIMSWLPTFQNGFAGQKPHPIDHTSTINLSPTTCTVQSCEIENKLARLEEMLVWSHRCKSAVKGLVTVVVVTLK